MTELMALSLTTGVLCGAWAQFATPLGLLTWAGFAGCTTYFASGKKGIDGITTTIRQNLFGVLCGMSIWTLSNNFSFTGNLIVFSGIVTFVMCIAGKNKYLAFIPGTFVGAFSTFAANGEWFPLVLSLLAGSILAYLCDISGRGLFLISTKLKK
ncbi:MAG: DUF1097 domain-containing protein [Streptococcaceae bacterium]|jgi:hypothetical protein|nr:DUF1097 domain-containing protein [Streptococcaceae bacterium]